MGELGAASPAARAMIRWLADKGPDVWFAVTPLLTSDNADPVLQWIASQPQTDKANAAMIFWMASPGAHARQFAEGKAPRAEGAALIKTILHRWQNGLYPRSELAWPDADGRAAIADYEREVAATPGAREALAIPKDLFGPFAGHAPQVPPALTPANNPQLWELLSRLGAQVGPRPGGERKVQVVSVSSDPPDVKGGWNWVATLWVSLWAVVFVLVLARSLLS